MLGIPKKTSQATLTSDGVLNLTSDGVLKLDGLHKSFGGVQAVRDLHLDVAPGEIVALLGPSGCGKTTTLRLVAGLDSPDSGRVFLNGQDATKTPPERRGIGFVFQDYALFPHLSVEANVGFGLSKMPADARMGRVAEVLALVGLSEQRSRLPHQLSGGQQQRAALARALAPAPSLVLLDEPLSNLDPQLRRRVRHEIVAIIRSSSAAALWVTHDHDEGLIVSDRVAVMNRGTAEQVGSPAEIWRSPSSAWIARFTGQGDFLSGNALGGEVQTPLGPVLAPGLDDGAPAEVLVRPEDVIFDSEGCPGKVVRRHFSGTDNVYCVELASGALLHCRQPADVEIPRGTPVGVRFNSSQLRVFA